MVPRDFFSGQMVHFGEHFTNLNLVITVILTWCDMQCVYCALYVNKNAVWWMNHIFNRSLWVFVKWHEKYYGVKTLFCFWNYWHANCHTFILALRLLPVWSESETSLYLHCMVLLTVNYPKHPRHWPREEADDSTTTPKMHHGNKRILYANWSSATQALLYQSFGLVMLLL